MEEIKNYFRRFRKPMIITDLTKIKHLSAALALAIVLGAWAAFSPLAAGAQAMSDDGPTLRDLADRHGLKIGTAVCSVRVL